MKSMHLFKIIERNEKCDDAADDDEDIDDDDNDADGQHDPYVSAMLRRRYKKYHSIWRH